MYDDSVFVAELSKKDAPLFLNYAHIFEALGNTTQDAMDKKIYSALESLCMLSYYNNSEAVYGPFFLPAGEKPTFSISQDVYDTLAGVVDYISDVRLRARVSDVLWLASKQLGCKDGFKYAKMAVWAFSQIPIKRETWILANIEYDWRRGLILAKSLGNAVRDEYRDMCKKIKDAFVSACNAADLDNVLCLSIPKLLDNDQLCDVIPADEIAETIEKLLSNADNSQPELEYSAYCDIAQNCYMRVHREADAIRMIKLKISKKLMAIMEEVSKTEPVWFRLSAMCQRVIPFLQSIPHQYREDFDVGNKILFLKHVSSLGYKIGKKGMYSYQTPSIDITQEVERAKTIMRDVSKEEVLLLFASLFSLHEKDAEALAERERKECVVPHIMGKSIIKGDKVVASAPAYSEVQNTDARVEIEKVQKAIYLLQCAYSMRLRPAYEVIREEHEFTFDGFLGFVSASPLVPESHRNIFAEGLLLGWQGHFSASTYVLAPEIENVLREQLKFQACDTTVIDSETKLENGVGLSTLVEKYADAIKSVFGSDFLFEIKAVFCSHAGPNVRNEVAHGLKDDGSFNGVIDFYVWWFAIRLLSMRERVHGDSGK